MSQGAASNSFVSFATFVYLYFIRKWTNGGPMRGPMNGQLDQTVVCLKWTSVPAAAPPTASSDDDDDDTPPAPEATAAAAAALVVLVVEVVAPIPRFGVCLGGGGVRGGGGGRLVAGPSFHTHDAFPPLNLRPAARKMRAIFYWSRTIQQRRRATVSS